MVLTCFQYEGQLLLYSLIFRRSEDLDLPRGFHVGEDGYASKPFRCFCRLDIALHFGFIVCDDHVHFIVTTYNHIITW